MRWLITAESHEALLLMSEYEGCDRERAIQSFVREHAHDIRPGHDFVLRVSPIGPAERVTCSYEMKVESKAAKK